MSVFVKAEMSGLTARQMKKSGMPAKARRILNKTFYAEYRYKGCKPEVKKAIIKWAVDGARIRATAQGLWISTDTVIIEQVNKEYFETHKT